MKASVIIPNLNGAGWLRDSIESVCRFEHIKTAHIFTTESFWCNCNLDLVTRHDFIMNDTRRIVLCINTVYRIFYYGFAKISFLISLSDSLVNGIFNVTAFKMNLLSNFQKYNGHTGILTNWYFRIGSNLHIFFQLT